MRRSRPQISTMTGPARPRAWLAATLAHNASIRSAKRSVAKEGLVSSTNTINHTARRAASVFHRRPVEPDRPRSCRTSRPAADPCHRERSVAIQGRATKLRRDPLDRHAAERRLAMPALSRVAIKSPSSGPWRTPRRQGAEASTAAAPTAGNAVPSIRRQLRPRAEAAREQRVGSIVDQHRGHAIAHSVTQLGGGQSTGGSSSRSTLAVRAMPSGA